MKNALKKLNTLKVKFPIITFFTYMILVTVTLISCYNHFFRNMLSTYESIGEEILNHASDDINIDHIPDYLAGDYDREEYEATLNKLENYVLYYNEIYYLYAYKINEGSDIGTVIFDAQTDHDTIQSLGEDYEIEPDILASRKKLENGEYVEPVTDNTEWGYLMTCSKPLIDSNGVCQGYLFVDFNLTEAKAEDIRFIMSLFVVVFIFMLIILYLGMRVVAKRITVPIEKMYLCLRSFSFASDQDREDNFERLRNLDIKTNPEIQSLYEALVTATLESYTYQQEYEVATEKLGVAREMAFRDALTGVGNKNAYENELKALQGKIDAGQDVELTVLMVDINNLKYVNDTFGHGKGDSYIKGCCELVRKRCRHSPIFRIGGDEFTVLLKGIDHNNAQSILEDIEKTFESTFADEARHPWDRFSASVGAAGIEPDDTKVSDVVKRADSAMYKAKAEFKQKYGSYR